MGDWSFKFHGRGTGWCDLGWLCSFFKIWSPYLFFCLPFLLSLLSPSPSRVSVISYPITLAYFYDIWKKHLYSQQKSRGRYCLMQFNLNDNTFHHSGFISAIGRFSCGCSMWQVRVQSIDRKHPTHMQRHRGGLELISSPPEQQKLPQKNLLPRNKRQKKKIWIRGSEKHGDMGS